MSVFLSHVFVVDKSFPFLLLSLSHHIENFIFSLILSLLNMISLIQNSKTFLNVFDYELLIQSKLYFLICQYTYHCVLCKFESVGEGFFSLF